jgi:hypothetical protein
LVHQYSESVQTTARITKALLAFLDQFHLQHMYDDCPGSEESSP